MGKERPKKSLLQMVKEIEARKPKVLTKKYSERYLGAIRWLMDSFITVEEASSYYETPKDIYDYYEKKIEKVERYIKEHF